jgi:hypothetical protein
MSLILDASATSCRNLKPRKNGTSFCPQMRHWLNRSEPTRRSILIDEISDRKRNPRELKPVASFDARQDPARARESEIHSAVLGRGFADGPRPADVLGPMEGSVSSFIHPKTDAAHAPKARVIRNL